MAEKTFTLDSIQDYRKPGIYFLYKDDILVYIGVTKNIYVRILEHSFDVKKDFDSFKTFKDETDFDYTSLEIVEVFLINCLTPKYNKLVAKSTFTYFNTLPTSVRPKSYKKLMSITSIIIEDVSNQGYIK